MFLSNICKVKNSAGGKHFNKQEQYIKQKLLGIILYSPCLNFIEHMKYLRDQCNNRINLLTALRATRWGTKKKLLRRVYISFIRSKIEYGCTVFGRLSKKNLRILEVLQNN
jgi:hypothetical protein